LADDLADHHPTAIGRFDPEPPHAPRLVGNAVEGFDAGKVDLSVVSVHHVQSVVTSDGDRRTPIGEFKAALTQSKEMKKMDTRVFELRTYTAAPGRIDDLHARFRDHTLKLFEKHQMTVMWFWRPADEQQAKRQLVYLLAFSSQEAALKSWKDFQADPQWKSVKAASEKDGPIVEKIDSVYLKPTDYWALK
jgi:hypothetical protein